MKKTIIVFATAFILILGALIFVPYFMDLEKYKSHIVDAIEERVGKRLAIGGRISFSVLPDIALILHDVSVSEPLLADTDNSQDQTLIDVSELRLKMKWRPLFSGNIELDSFELSRPKIFLSDVSDETDPVAKESAPSTGSEASVSVTEDVFTPLRSYVSDITQLVQDVGFENIRVTNGSLKYENAKSSEVVELTGIDLTTSFLPQVNPFRLRFNLHIPDSIDDSVSLKGAFHISNNTITVSDVELGFGKLTGRVDIFVDVRDQTPEFKLSIYSNHIDINKFAVGKDKKQSHSLGVMPTALSGPVESEPFEFDKERFDFSIFKKFSANISVKTDRLTYEQIKIGALDVNSFLRNGKLSVSLKKANIYKGSVSGELELDVTGDMPSLSHSILISDVDLAQLPDDVGVLDYVKGLLEADVKLNTRGHSQYEFVKNLGGTGRLDIKEGGLQGIDLFGMIGNVTSAFSLGNRLKEKTKFDKLSTSFMIKKGIIYNDDLKIYTRLIQFDGKGDVDLPRWLINYKITPRLSVGVDKPIDKLGLRVPVIVRGKLNNPIIAPDVIAPINTIVQHPKKAGELVDQLKNDFKNIRDNFESDGLGVLEDLQGIFQGR